MKKKKLVLANVLLVIVPVIACLIVAEVMLRATMKTELSIINDERSLMYTHDDTLGWLPSKNSTGTFKGLNEVSVRHNSRGFRDEEHIPGEKNRMMVLGDSFVWGYDVEEKDRFTEILNEKLENTQVFNLGVSGFGTDQEWLLLQKNYDFYQPDVVFLMFCTDNDRLDNRMNLRYQYFYKPYFVEEKGSLVAKGIPVPTGYRQFVNKYPFASKFYLFRLAASSYFNIKEPVVYLDSDPTFTLIKAMKSYSELKGSTFLVGLQRGDDSMEHFLESEEIAFVNVENNYLRGWHWNEKGHEYVAREIEDFLIKNDFSW